MLECVVIYELLNIFANYTISFDILREEPCGRDRRASEIEYLFSVSFPLVRSPQRLAGARILPTCSGSQERFWTSQNDRNKVLRQRPQGVKFINSA